jgi:hypothetical protein
MAAVTDEIMNQLKAAQAGLESLGAGGPPVVAEVAAMETAAPAFAAAGSGQAQHVLVDHYYTGSLRRLWAYAGGQWRYVNVTSAEEQGLAQLAYAANRVDAWWDGNNKLTLMRCWKNF